MQVKVSPTSDPDWDDEDEYWAQIDDNIPLQNGPETNETTDGSKRQHQAVQSRSALIQIISILCTFVHDRMINSDCIIP